MAQNPDIRVRLSAEGVEEVIRALKAVEAQATKSGKAGSKGLGLMNDALGDLKNLLPQLGIAAAVTGIVAMTKNALESADAIGKLSQKTGVSTQTLSGMRVAADLADASFEQLSKGLLKFNKTMGDLDEGSKETAEAVERLFGSSRALDGLGTEERLRKVIEALGRMEPGYRKTKAAMDFFGKSGAELIPMLDDLSNGGLERAIQKAKELGLVIDEDLAKAAQTANDNLKELKLAAEGAATQFAAGLAPAVADASKALLDATTGEGVNGLRKVGEAVGFVVKLIVAGFVVVGKTIGTVLALVSEGFSNTVERFKLLAETMVTLPTTAPTQWGKMFDKLNRFEQSAKARRAAMIDSLKGDLVSSLDKLFNAAPDAQGGTTDKGGDDDKGGTVPPDKSALKAYIALQEARLDQQLALYQKYLEMDEAAAKAAYARGITELEKYYEERRVILFTAMENELATLQAKRELAAKEMTETEAEAIQKQAKLEAIDAAIAQKKVDREAKLADLRNEEAEKLLDLKKQQEQAEQQILQAHGKTYEAAMASIKTMAAEMEKKGIKPETIKALTTALERQAGFQQLQRQGGALQGQLAAARERIDNRVAGGEIFPFEAAEQYRAVIQAMLPQLIAVADQMERMATTDEERSAVAALRGDLAKLGIEANQDAQQIANFKASVESAITSDLTNFFAKGIEEAESFGDAMRALALSVVESLRQIAAEMLATYATQQLLGAVGGVFGGFTGGKIVAAAGGGLVSGPGTGTSDSIPARLSNGEFVVRSAVVSQPGVLDHLIALNRGATVRPRGGGIPRFADGGLVTASEAMSSVNIRADFGLDEGVIPRRMKAWLRSPEGQRVQIENLSMNQKRARNALGR